MGVLVRVEEIRKYLRDNNLTEVAFSNMCKISKTTLNKILKSRRSKRLTIMIKIARQMGVKLGDIVYFEKDWV